MNKAVLAFQNKGQGTVKYGKWVYQFGRLYFGYRLVAKRTDDVLEITEYRLQDCGFEYPTYHSLNKATRFLKKINNKKSLIFWSGSFIIYLRNAGTKKPECKTPELGDF